VISLDQTSVDELYAVARVTNSLLTGRAKKAEFKHYVWFYDEVTDILARALLDNEDHSEDRSLIDDLQDRLVEQSASLQQHDKILQLLHDKLPRQPVTVPTQEGQP
jgi:Mg2+ and Co2+ transporter CorA